MKPLSEASLFWSICIFLIPKLVEVVIEHCYGDFTCQTQQVTNAYIFKIAKIFKIIRGVMLNVIWRFPRGPPGKWQNVFKGFVIRMFLFQVLNLLHFLHMNVSNIH